MSKNELMRMFSNIKVGDSFYNLKIDGLNENDTDTVLQEFARKNNIEFEISVNFYNNKKEIIYNVIKPSKKFLNKKGSWNMEISKKAKDFLENI